jgi:hypothetical protein
MRGDGIFADSAIAAIIFKIKLSALMNFIQKLQILGKIPRRFASCAGEVTSVPAFG